MLAAVFSAANILEAGLLLWFLRRDHPDIRLIENPRQWLLSIGGMMVLLTGTQPFLPILPFGPLTSAGDWIACSVHLMVLAVAFGWGVTWGSNRFALLRATRRGANQ
jgi:hypothetical protein